MTIDEKFIGKRYPQVSYEIGKEKINEFIRATKGNPDKYQNLLPLTFPVVYASSLLEYVLYDPELNLNLKKLVHGDQEFIYHKPAKSGDTINSEGFIENIFSKRGHDFVIFKVESKNQFNEPVSTQKMTFVVRGGNDKDFSAKEKLFLKLAALKSKLNPFKKKVFTEESKINYHRVSENQFTMDVYIDKYMPQRYAGASGDFNAIHLDDDLGKNSGLGGYILHGMATMALAGNLAAEFKNTQEVKNFKARFSLPVSPGNKLFYTASFTGNNEHQYLEITAKNELKQNVLELGYLDFC